MTKIKVLILSFALSLFFYSSQAYADYYSEGFLLYYGISSYEVNNLQKDLQTLGYFSLNPTYYFGNATKQTVINFQKDHQLITDGVVGKNTAREIKADLIMKTAKECLGIPYVWGGTTQRGFDCSGFTQYVFGKNEISIPRTAGTQYLEGIWVSKSQLKTGDLVFFQTYTTGPSHVGIYMEDGLFIHASSGKGEITISRLDNPYYAQHYLGAKRIV